MASVVQHLRALKVRLSHRPLYPKPQNPEGTDLAEVWSSSADPTTTRLRFKLLVNQRSVSSEPHQKKK